MLADDHGRVRMVKRRRSAEQMKRRRRQGVLIRASVEVFAHQLFRRGVEDRAHRHIRRGEVVGVVDPAGNTEVAQQDSLVTFGGIAQHYVGRLHIAVQKALLMRIVESLGDAGDDVEYVLLGHALGVAVTQQLGCICAVHVVHGDPDLAVHVAAVVNADDVRVPQRRGEVGFPVESPPVLVVGADVVAQHLERVAPGQARVLGQVDVAHASGTQKPHDGVVREGLTSG